MPAGQPKNYKYLNIREEQAQKIMNTQLDSVALPGGTTYGVSVIRPESIGNIVTHKEPSIFAKIAGYFIGKAIVFLRNRNQEKVFRLEG